MADEIYGNDERIEALWAIKAMEHAEVYFNVSYEEVIMYIVHISVFTNTEYISLFTFFILSL